MNVQEVEDILHDSLACLGEQPAPENNTVQYGPLKLEIPPKEGKVRSPDISLRNQAITLLADQLFSPALYLAERVERGHIPVAGLNVLELGAGSGLPSLLMATLIDYPALVVVTDYPDEHMIGNLKRNIERNRLNFQAGCHVECIAYEWGGDVEPLLKLLASPSGRYDAMILSDLLHFNDSHDVLVSSITSLLSKSEMSKAYISAGKYTRREVCESFLIKGRRAGLEFEEIRSVFEEAQWRGTMEVSGLDKDALGVRKANCYYWIGSWANK